LPKKPIYSTHCFRQKAHIRFLAEVKNLRTANSFKKHRKNFAETTFISYILVGASAPQPPPDREPWYWVTFLKKLLIEQNSILVFKVFGNNKTTFMLALLFSMIINLLENSCAFQNSIWNF